MAAPKPATWKLTEQINGRDVACGCVVDAFRYHKVCARHQKEWDEVHQRWTADHLRLMAEQEAAEPST